MVISFLVLFELKIGPIVKQIALARVTYLAGKVINDAINEQIELDYNQFEDLITFHKTSDGLITAYTPNYGKINLLKVNITDNVLDRINLTKSLRSVVLPTPGGETMSRFGKKGSPASSS
jgi:hypothetical protein